MLFEDRVEVDSSYNIAVREDNVLSVGVFNESPNTCEGIESALVDASCLAVRREKVETALFT